MKKLKVRRHHGGVWSGVAICNFLNINILELMNFYSQTFNIQELIFTESFQKILNSQMKQTDSLSPIFCSYSRTQIHWSKSSEFGTLKNIYKMAASSSTAELY